MNSGPIKIIFTGDLCPHNRIEELVLKSDYKSVINDFEDVLKGNDLIVTDLECPLTTRKNGRKKTGPHQKADPGCIGLLKFLNIRLAALANNHIMDFGAEGAIETMKLCHDNGIDTVGAGKDINDARIPFIFDISDKKVAIINMAEHEFLSCPDNTFQANPLNPVNAFYDISDAKEKYDYVIVFAHGGNEFYHLPSPRIKSLYRFFIDVGADAVISHHTHCFSGYEVYKGNPVFYGLGNFIYDWPGRFNSNWNKGYIVRLFLEDKISFEIIPLKQGNELPGVFHMSERERAEFFKDIEHRNNIIADDTILEKEFEKYTKKITPMYDAYIEPYFGKIYTALRLRGFLPNLMTRKKRLLLLNLLRCEAHREVLIRILKKYE
ncbi:MAG: CapA family protein [Bacteroidales bacterium]|nr:CapA family protein [Bacteroidales bacterium]